MPAVPPTPRAPRHLRRTSTAPHPHEIEGRGRLRCGAKRGFDLAVGGVVVVVLSPFLAALTLWLWVSNGRPALYRQTRVGRHGVPFTMLKFRSMVPDAHEQRHDLLMHNQRNGPLFKMHEDPRVTKTGRFMRATSLDELPQLFNVLAGTMSLVGPRPALFEERDDFPPDLLAREQMRPGITGLWQVNARRDPDFDTYHKLDLEYVQSWTLLGDLMLLVRTPVVVVRECFHAGRHAPVPVNTPQPRSVAEEPQRNKEHL